MKISKAKIKKIIIETMQIQEAISKDEYRQKRDEERAQLKTICGLISDGTLESVKQFVSLLDSVEGKHGGFKNINASIHRRPGPTAAERAAAPNRPSRFGYNPNNPRDIYEIKISLGKYQNSLSRLHISTLWRYHNEYFKKDPGKFITSRRRFYRETDKAYFETLYNGGDFIEFLFSPPVKDDSK